MRQWHDRRRPLVVAVLLVALLLTTSVGGPLVGTVTSAPADQPPATPSPVTAPGLVRLRASHTDVPAGQAVTLSARVEQAPPGPFVVTIRREGGSLASGLAAACWSQTACNVEERADQAASRTYAADLYQCDARGTCLLMQEADPSAEVRVVWRR